LMGSFSSKVNRGWAG